MEKDQNYDRFREILSGFGPDESPPAKDLDRRQKQRELGESGKSFPIWLLVDTQARELEPSPSWIKPLLERIAGTEVHFSQRSLSRVEAETYLGSVQVIRNPGPLDETPVEAGRRFLSLFGSGATFYLVTPEALDGAGIWMQEGRTTLSSAVIAFDRTRLGILGEGFRGRPYLKARYLLVEDTDEKILALEDEFHDYCRAHEMFFAARSFGFQAELMPDPATLADTLVEGEGMLALKDRWKKISPELARAVATQLLWRDLVFDEEEMPKEEAESLARRFCERAGPGVTFLTSGTWEMGTGGTGLKQSGGISLMAKDREGGVIAVGSERILAFWVGWEDPETDS